MSRKCNTKHPYRGRSHYPERVRRNGGADRYGHFVNGVRQSADVLMKNKRPEVTS